MDVLYNFLGDTFNHNSDRIWDNIIKAMFSHDHEKTWCEPDYANHHYIAEFWNTISNIVLFCLSLYGIYWHHKLHHKLQTSYLVCILIAIGSAWYHSTISRFGQLADEIPMLILCTMFAQDFTNIHILPNITTIFVSIYILFDYYLIFVLYFSCLMGFVIVVPFFQRKKYLQRVLYHKSLIVFTVAYLCWIIDINACNLVQQLHLHAWWHVLSAFGLYWYIQSLMARYGRLHHGFPLEVVRIYIN